jgi:hypothetical protein
MAEIDIKFKDQTYKIDGSDELISFIKSLHGEYETLSTQTSNQPSLKEQLALWEKAKPIFASQGKEVDFDMSPIDVMKVCLGDKYKTEGISDETVSYLFNNVLTAENPEDAQTQTSTSGTPVTEKTKTSKTAEKPKTTPVGTIKNITSAELEQMMADKRLSGTATATKTN